MKSHIWIFLLISISSFIGGEYETSVYYHCCREKMKMIIYLTGLIQICLNLKMSFF
jgi:hypothetical protein